MGHKGWHKRGYLPHFDGHGIVQHVVFRLYDALPPEERDGGDDALDKGLGAAILRDPRVADVVVAALRHYDGERYDLCAWCVMPNHVHVLVATRREYELGRLVNLWKSYSARRINAMIGRQGPLWAADYFDRFMRNEAHFDKTKSYIEMNPVVAGLCARAAEWRHSSAGWSQGGG